ncbi:MAG: hypothetical protein AB1650_08465 [Candidatus Omnitrophota bacterium]
MKPFLLIIFIFIFIFSFSSAEAQDSVHGNTQPGLVENDMGEAIDPNVINETIFDDTLLLEGFTERYLEEAKDTLLARIQDETLEDIKIAAAVRAFRKKYAAEIFSLEKASAENILLRQLSRSDSAFIQVEIMHTLCLMDRYKYFHSYVPPLIQKLDHYNAAINQSAYQAINEIISKGNNRSREARIVFNTLRKILFLTRRRLAKVTHPDGVLSQKIEILKWSVKVLGSQELRRLPKEVLNLL